MSEDKTSVWQSATAQQLVAVLLAMESKEDLQNFLRDLLTENELVEISSRLEAARMLQAGATYNDIIAKTRLSSRTIARISDWMQNGCGGYTLALSQLNDHHAHPSPAPAD